MTSAIISALNVLTKPLGAEAHVRETQSSQRDAILGALRTNRVLLLEQLQSDKSLKEAWALREAERTAAAWFCSEAEEDVPWAFAQECFLLLLTLARHLSTQMALFERTPPAANQHTPEAAPALPPDVLSVSQQKTLGAALQFTVSLGLCAHLVPGVGLALERRSAFGPLLAGLVRRDGAAPSAPPAARRLLTATTVLLRLSELPSLATLVYTRHLGDLMAALCQLGHQPQRSQGDKDLNLEERTACRAALKSILGTVYQPIVIKELLILQGGPKQVSSTAGANGAPSRPATVATPAWLRRLCGQLLSDRLMQPHGVHAVARAILEGGTGGDSDWRRCDGVARILVACPQQCVSADLYYRQVCPQIIELLHFRDKLTARQFQHVATRAALTIVEEKPQFGGQYLLEPLLGPLKRCCSMATGEASVEEWELSRCVDDVYKIWVIGNSASVPVLTALEQVLSVVFSLFCFTKQNVSHLRAPCQEILLWYLGHAEQAQVFPVLRGLCSLDGQEGGGASGLHFTPGSDGGAQLAPRGTDRPSDEDEALYERVSGEQRRVECLVLLLAELKDSDLPGDFFLELLQELTLWAAEEDEEEQEVDLGTMSLLEAEEHRSGRAAAGSRRLALLQALAALCEGLPHATLLRKTTQVVGFVVSLLQRACAGLGQASGPTTEQPVESETLSMAMGLVATLLSEPQKLGAEDYACMARLLPPLHEVSLQHPEPLIQGLAGDLRAVIATHGAYRPEGLPAGASPERDDATRGGNAPPPPGDRSHPPATATRPAADTTTVHTHPLPPPPPGPIGGPQAHVGPLKSVDARTVSPTAATRPCRPGPLPEPPRSFSDWLLEACDPDVPTRAVALRRLTRLVTERHPAALQAEERVLVLFLENLEHDDTFVYLSAIQGLAALADSFPERILERLLGEFRGPSRPDREHALETRLKVGEVLMRASRAMGDLAPHLGRPLMVAFLQGTRDQDPTVRASSLSNLGELSHRLDYALGPLALELSSCLSALIKTEKEAEVRRAAVHVITLLLRGLSEKTTQVLGDVLLDLYRSLKWAVRSDPDQVTVLHAQLALEELDDVMKCYIFPKQKLEKKIVVLP
ncbi:transport and Golgi organization protein 6 homolog isoform X1 [Gadus macrocephalus]|uniref:transport and Golgi organization protein 6 homolog isoform X1 n=1 Tax=Gadus macrocephalus TaxID=80720 RepID=UPI0028CB221B|nr:transport and Golgi organization protein 6 homolog isoform X1 [Gadus macrocephalus]